MSTAHIMTIVLSILFPSLMAALGEQTEGHSDTADFINSIKAGDVAKVREMLARNSKLIQAKDNDGASAILKAVYYRKKEVLDVLLSSGVELDIFEAAALGKNERVRSLIASSPSMVNAYAPDGFYPLGLAAFFGHAETTKVLLEAGARVDTASRNHMHVTALHAAAASGNLEIARLLIEHGADVNARQEQDFTPLHEAAASGKVQLAQLLLDRGADVNIRNQKGKTALGFAVEAGQKEAEALLRARGGTQ